jgi:hypothetical protein
MFASPVPRTPGVVEVQQIRAYGRKQVTDPAGSRHAGGVAEGDPVGAVGPDPSHDAGHPIGVDVTLEGTAEAGRDDHFERGAGVVHERDQAGDVVERLLGGPVEIAAVVRVARRDHDFDLAKARGEGSLRTPGVRNE